MDSYIGGGRRYVRAPDIASQPSTFFDTSFRKLILDSLIPNLFSTQFRICQGYFKGLHNGVSYKDCVTRGIIGGVFSVKQSNNQACRLSNITVNSLCIGELERNHSLQAFVPAYALTKLRKSDMAVSHSAGLLQVPIKAHVSRCRGPVILQREFGMRNARVRRGTVCTRFII